MMLRSRSLFLPWALAMFAFLVREAESKLEPHIWCGACIAMVEDMKIQISTVDKKKKIEVGYRILPDGSRDKKEVPYASSDLFLTEELERICNAMHHYAETTNKKGEKIIIRKSSYDGTSVSLENISMSPELTRSLVFACQTIIEEHEDEIIEHLKSYNRKDEGREIEKDLCIGVTGLCTADDVQARMWAMASAVMAGIQEKADERLKDSQAQEALDARLAEEEAAGARIPKIVAENSAESPNTEDLGEDITEQLIREGSIEVGSDKDEL